MNLGIDLGTTFSVVAVKGKVPLVEGYPAKPVYIPALDVTIIPDSDGNHVIPSAVAEDPTDAGGLIVGARALGAAETGPAPILFSKRTIGTDARYRLTGREFSSREVATIILGHLKAVAEQALGERVTQAVITHPAYFDPAMRLETAEAAKAAGLDVDPETHLLMEPTAAALAYSRTDDRDPLRVLTYDLGGGTFDVTVMVRQEGTFTIRDFGGNRLLGGHTFDRRLATWIYQRLRDSGINLTVDAEHPERHAAWIRLLQLAEDTKLRLASARTDRVPVNIRDQLRDDDGHPVQVSEEISRADFVLLIEDLLTETLTGSRDGETKGCEAVLAKAGMAIDDMDEILLVGGSTAGPWVADAIRARWGREPMTVQPDRIVAAGAAHWASTLPTVVAGADCTLHVDTDRQSMLDVVTVAGRVETGPTASGLDLTVVLTDEAGRTHVATPEPDGRFHLPDVALRYGTVTTFAITVGEVDRRPLAEHVFQIEHVMDGPRAADTPGVLRVLPKPLYVQTAEGPVALADEGAVLPARRTVRLRRINDYDTIAIRILQEHDPIGSVEIRQIPAEAPRGSSVVLDVEVSPSNTISGRATVHAPGGVAVREVPVEISIPRMEIPSVAELERRLAVLEEDLAERLELETDPNGRMMLRADGDRLVGKARALAEQPVPDPQEIWLVLRALDRAVHPVRETMSPSLEEFEQLLLEIRSRVARAAGDPNIQAVAQTVDRIERAGRSAYEARQGREWGTAYGELLGVLGRLRSGGESGSDQVLTSVETQQEFAYMRLDQTRVVLRTQEMALAGAGVPDLATRVQGISERIAGIEAEVRGIPASTEPRTAAVQIQLRLGSLSGIEQEIERLRDDVGRG